MLTDEALLHIADVDDVVIVGERSERDNLRVGSDMSDPRAR